MRTHIGWLVIAAGIVGWPAQTAVLEQDAPPALTVRAPGAALQPGDVGVVVVNASRTLPAIEGTAFGRPVRFWAAGGGQWHGLVGVGLETRPGTYAIAVRGADPQGAMAVAETAVTVTAKAFETRRLRVAQRFVTPPADEAERIQEDARMLARAFGESAPDRLWRGPFVPPVPGAATSSFGRLTLLNGQPNGRHQGADFRASTGAPTVAPNAGRVVLAADLYFAGNTVVIDHGLGLFSLLAHLSRISVGVGTTVAQGDRIGDVGATGRVTGPHLHWAVRIDALSVDPLSLIGVAASLPEPDAVLATR